MMMDYVPPTLQRGGHAQSIMAATVSVAPHPAWQRTRWELDDGDFCDVDWLHPLTKGGNGNSKDNTKDTAKNTAKDAHLLVLFHGLEGSSASHYARSVGAHFQSLGWRVVVPHFRGCSGEPNRLLRAYHSGDAAEIKRLLGIVRGQYPAAPMYAAGVSLGGNALLCYLSERNTDCPLQSAASICAPLDLGRCGEAITTGFSNIYNTMFMRTLLAKTMAKRARFPAACDWDALQATKTLYQFDDIFTGPIHGYAGTLDYYARASAKPKLRHITTATLLLNALNDPFVPADILRDLVLPAAIKVHQTAEGGHVGFATGSGRGELTWLPRRLLQWFEAAV